MRDKNWWAEIRNDHIEEDIDETYAAYGDTVMVLHIDAWKTEDDSEEGEVIAHVILTKSGDVCVSYKNSMAYGDNLAQEMIREGIDIMKDLKAESFQ